MDEHDGGKTVGSRGLKSPLGGIHWSVGIIMQAVLGCPRDFAGLRETRGGHFATAYFKPERDSQRRKLSR